MPDLKIMPSLLAADFGRFAEECRRAEAAGADELHLDVMDGHFVPNISFGPDVVRMARRSASLPLNVHLMISRPDVHLPSFVEAGSHTITIHIEAPCPVEETLRRIRAAGLRAGIALNPETPAESIGPLLEQGLVDEILCMTVHPGFGGQSFIAQVLPKIAALRLRAPALDINVDGGVNRETGVQAAAAGANLLVAGTFLFRAADMAAEIQTLRSSAAEALAGRAGEG